MELYILSAGESSRLSPIETNKPNLPCDGQQLTDIINNNIPSSNTTIIRKHDNYGTGAAVESISTEENVFIVANGDILPSKITTPKNIPTVYTYDVDEANGYGVIKNNKIVEKETSGPAEINAGIYYIDSRIFKFINEAGAVNGEYRLTDAINKYDKIYTKKLDSWMSVEYPWDLLDAQTEQYISDNASVHEDAIIRGNTYIGPNVTIGKNAEIKESVLLEGVTAEHHCYIGDSVVGKDVNIGAGVVTANLRHDEKTVSSKGIDTKRGKFGAVIGPRAKLGANTTLNPGTVIEADEWTLAGEVR